MSKLKISEEAYNRIVGALVETAIYYIERGEVEHGLNILDRLAAFQGNHLEQREPDFVNKDGES